MDTISIPISFSEIIVRLLVATLFGAAVGLNRERQRKPAGLRTHALVALGAALLMIVALLLSTGDIAASGRVLQGIIAGIGFIGGGVIMRRQDMHDVQGLTTAAGIWVVSAIGIAAGAGLWRTALIALALTLIVLIGGAVIERWLHRSAE
jgi:putative Mg2+ transporter-C (MgtC) family protein